MRKKLVILFAFIILLNCTACTPYENYNGTDEQETKRLSEEDTDSIMDKGPVKGGTLNLFSTPPDTLNPILTQNTFVSSFLDLVYEGMVKVGKDQRPLPALSDKWDVSDDGLVWTFHIRKNVLWHNNMPLTADDVKFTLETIQNSKVNSIYKKNLQNIALYTAVDANNFRIFLKKSNSFTAEMMTFPIIPRHIFLNDDVTKVKSSKNMEPVGTGPYKIMKAGKSSELRLIENNKWWALKENSSETNAPYIGDINIKIFNNSKDEVNSLQTGDVDLAFVSAGDFSKYSGRPDIKLKKYTGKNYEFLAFNLDNTVLANKAVRQAIAFCINRREIINEFLPGQATIADIPLIPNTWLYDTNIISYNPDKQKARMLLEQDGWKGDGRKLYKKINGVRKYLDFEILVNDINEMRFKIGEKICSQLKEIGINAVVKRVKWEDELKQIKARKFDMAIMGYRTTSIPDISFAYSSFEAAGGWNVAGYKNAEVDSYIEQILSEKDMRVKKVAFTAMKDIIIEDTPYLGLYFTNNGVLINKRVKGEMNPCAWNRFNDITKWYIAKGY